MADVKQGRWTAEIEGDFVVFVIGSAARRIRIDSVDILRGLVMVIMALDHVRDFLGASVVNPRDVGDTALFVTRWITHFCAPTFIFLAGVSAYLHGHRGRSRAQIARFLLTRGLWLVVLEVTVVRLATTFSVWPEAVNFQVIWAIGWSMVALSALVLVVVSLSWAFAADAFSFPYDPARARALLDELLQPQGGEAVGDP